MQIIKLNKKATLLKSTGNIGYQSVSEKVKSQSLQDFILKNYSRKEIVEVIKSIGEEFIAGFSGISEDDVIAILSMCEEFELIDIRNALKHRRLPQNL